MRSLFSGGDDHGDDGGGHGDNKDFGLSVVLVALVFGLAAKALPEWGKESTATSARSPSVFDPRFLPYTVLILVSGFVVGIIDQVSARRSLPLSLYSTHPRSSRAFLSSTVQQRQSYEGRDTGLARCRSARRLVYVFTSATLTVGLFRRGAHLDARNETNCSSRGTRSAVVYCSHGMLRAYVLPGVGMEPLHASRRDSQCDGSCCSGRHA